ncbi:hypothetical protein [Streptomyces sp. NPDC057509]|uniref:hypothetical protein n=1 Tax=Streptomyces sp. NPDC057509 TaxID=3346152 RepID=UPI0036918409
MNARQFKDCDGDIWEPSSAGYLRCVVYSNGSPREDGRIETREWVERNYGPLTEIRPDVDVRALLAEVLEDMAEDVRKEYWRAVDPVSERVFERLGDVLDVKARELREAT